MWFIEDLARLDLERRAISDLDDRSAWLDEVVWYIDVTGVYVDCDLFVGRNRYPIRLRFPTGYPASPPAVRPRGDERWSAHQYGAGGDLCLELGPDNWDPDLHNAAHVLESAEKLLRLESAPDVHNGTGIVSRHATTRGQETRFELLRFALTEHTAEFLNGLRESEVVHGKVVTTYHANSCVSLLVSATVNGGDWNDPGIPAKALAAQGLAQSAVILSEKCSRQQWQHLSTRAGLDALLEAKLGKKAEMPKCVIVPDVRAEGEWTLLARWTDGSDPWRYTSVNVSTDNAATRVGLDTEALKNRRVALVGAGSAGARVALSLARSGVRRFVVIDDDLVQPVNLVRHDADWHSVGTHKADHIAERIRRLQPDADVAVRKHRLGGQESASSAGTVVRALIDSDLIIDCTASHSVFNLVGEVSRRSKTPMIWMEVFAGGVGGLVARARPGCDADPLTLRRAINAFCEERPDTTTTVDVDYVGEDEGGRWLVATDAEVNLIAHHATRLALDTLEQIEPSDFQYQAYFVGMRRGWIFDAPFHTIPLDCTDPGRWGVEESLEPSTAGDMLQFLKEILARSATGDDANT